MEEKRSKFPDVFLTIVVFSLIMIGLLILCSVSMSYSQKEFGDPLYIFVRQIKNGLLPGIILGILFFLIPLRHLRKYSLHLMLFALFLTSMVFLPSLGIKLGGASRWISLGPFTLQPSEILKLASVIYIAAWLSKWDSGSQDKKRKPFVKKRKSLKEEWIKKNVPFLVIILSIVFLLISQPDVGTLLVIMASSLSMYLVATADLKSLFLIFAVFLIIAIILPLAGYRIDRIITFLNAEQADPLGEKYQLNQSLIAIGSGGLFGKGITSGVQKLGFLPQPIADSIFAAFAEEGGFLGSSLIVILFLFFVFLSFKISQKSSNTFAKIMAIGIPVWIISQAFLNIGSSLGIIPFTGIPLPFIAQGGSHLSIELAASGLLLNLSRY